jgi:hypothetical protein
MQFLENYPNQWNSLAKDARTVRAFKRLQALYGSRVFEFSEATNQMRFVPSELLK